MAAKTKDPAPALRRCIGTKRYGIESHEAPVEDFPLQPSQKDGRGRMCRTHWNQYTAGLARDAKARRAAEGGPVAEASAPAAKGADPAPKAKAPRARKGGPTDDVGSGPGGEVPASSKRRRIASTPQGRDQSTAPAVEAVGGQSPDAAPAEV